MTIIIAVLLGYSTGCHSALCTGICNPDDSDLDCRGMEGNGTWKVWAFSTSNLYVCFYAEDTKAQGDIDWYL